VARIVDHDELVAAVAGHRAAGETIAFANGAFDLLHVGHTRYLQGAAAEGDVLVVALNSDASVRALKGSGRPVVLLADRAEMIAALAGVDYVTTFEETDVTKLLLALKPDVHAKGSDYTVDTVPEVETVRSYGGRVAIVGGPKDFNTTDIVARIQGREEGK
jgi:D-glycero-beta-D-manno-heptose 1-phosphate adenylyltransferase